MNDPESHKNQKPFLIITFLMLWFIYGATVNLWDQYGYNLMHAGVEALAERGTFSLQGSETPKFRQLEEAEVVPGRDASTDVFWKNNNLYPQKHPGMFFLGAIVYKPLSLIGIKYYKEYNLATSLVSWLTSGLLAALTVTLFLKMGLNEGLSHGTSIIAALSLGLGSIWFAYSGILHHDLLAGCFLFFACLTFINGHEKDRMSPMRVLIAGALGGFAFTCSPLAALLLLPFLFGVLLLRGWKGALLFVAGIIAGTLPLLIYNTVCFENPFTLPNAAGGVQDTVPKITVTNILEKLKWYFISPKTAFWAFFPVFIFAVAGLVMRTGKRAKEACLFIGGPVLLLVYIHIIESFGGAQFGPRYFIPILPVISVGFISFFKWLGNEKWSERSPLKKTVWILYGLLFALSITISASGAIRGTMYGMDPHPFIRRLTISLGLSGIQETPGAHPLVYPVIFFTSILLFIFLQKNRNTFSYQWGQRY